MEEDDVVRRGPLEVVNTNQSKACVGSLVKLLPDDDAMPPSLLEMCILLMLCMPRRECDVVLSMM